MTGKRSIVLLGITCALIFGVSPVMGQVIPEADVPALLTYILPVPAAGGLDIKLLCTFYSTYNVMELDSPNRIAVDFNGVEDIAAPRLVEVGQSGVLRIRAGMYLEGTARIVLDLADDMPSYRIAPIKDGLLLSIRPRPGAARAPEPRPAAKAEHEALGKAQSAAEEREKQFSIICWILRFSLSPAI